MASYLLNVASNGSLTSVAEVSVPQGAVVEWLETEDEVDGLERWTIEVVVAGSIFDFARGEAWQGLWDFLERAAKPLEARPQARLALKSRTDAHRVFATFNYFGTREIKSTGATLKTQIAAHADPKSRRLLRDLELDAHQSPS